MAAEIFFFANRLPAVCRFASLAIFAVVAIKTLVSFYVPRSMFYVPYWRNGIPSWRSNASPFGVRLCRGRYRNIHALDLFNFVVIDLGKNQLILARLECSCRGHRRLLGNTRGSRGRAAEPRSSGDREIRYMRSPRSVTMEPIGMPSRSLNAAIDFLRLRDHRLLSRDRPSVR